MNVYDNGQNSLHNWRNAQTPGAEAEAAVAMAQALEVLLDVFLDVEESAAAKSIKGEALAVDVVKNIYRNYSASGHLTTEYFDRLVHNLRTGSPSWPIP